MRSSVKLLISLFIITLSSLSFAGNKTDISDPNTPQPIIKLSPETRDLLIREMRELQSGMKKIVPAITAKEWEKIATIGEQMENSYIMKKSMTQAQMHELHMSLPKDFQELDHFFHHSAGQLAQAAKQEDHSKVSYYYLKMTEACVNCHTLYATHKFPEFLKPKE